MTCSEKRQISNISLKTPFLSVSMEINEYYWPITEINQSDCSVAGPIFPNVPNYPARDKCVTMACKRETINFVFKKKSLVLFIFM